MFSQTAEYALRAVVHLAEEAGERPVRVGEIAQALDIPQNYLSKILYKLARSGVLTSARGKTGGFQLAVPPERLRLHSVIAPFDDIGERRQCLLGRQQCSDRRACSAHARWKGVAEAMAAFVRETSVADVSRRMAGAAT